ncbi:hypothetical protein EC396_00775 [Lutibacter sp. HS1-25]|uniref:hypothetical protein n=1 Tax=Lutibacter sp. HS1-25 TaxID=2485000 RepID=UPI0010136E77|nr:hypothetical protein [Lutibacter sp. HS1-25]RXP64542.1 hypothetical protein EC396_00775 [Lutibacter sp. HS1-25]
MDNFEKHIIKNKQQFEDYTPDASKMWAAISNELDKEKPKAIPLWKNSKFKIAASIVLILGIFSIVGLGFKNTPNKFSNQELQEIDMHYQSLVSYQVQLVKNNTHLSSTDKEEFLSFMVELDQEYELLKLELDENLDNELILEAIITNYKKRIELIENLLHQINNSKTTTNKDEYIL